MLRRNIHGYYTYGDAPTRLIEDFQRPHLIRWSFSKLTPSALQQVKRARHFPTFSQRTFEFSTLHDEISQTHPDFPTNPPIPPKKKKPHFTPHHYTITSTPTTNPPKITFPKPTSRPKKKKKQVHFFHPRISTAEVSSTGPPGVYTVVLRNSVPVMRSGVYVVCRRPAGPRPSADALPRRGSFPTSTALSFSSDCAWCSFFRTCVCSYRSLCLT